MSIPKQEWRIWRCVTPKRGLPFADISTDDVGEGVRVFGLTESHALVKANRIVAAVNTLAKLLEAAKQAHWLLDQIHAGSGFTERMNEERIEQAKGWLNRAITKAEPKERSTDGHQADKRTD